MNLDLEEFENEEMIKLTHTTNSIPRIKTITDKITANLLQELNKRFSQDVQNTMKRSVVFDPSRNPTTSFTTTAHKNIIDKLIEEEVTRRGLKEFKTRKLKISAHTEFHRFNRLKKLHSTK